MATNEEIRYDRQKRIENWKQEALTRAKIALIGSGQLAQFTAASAISLGIGNVDVYTAEGEKEKGFLTALGGGDKGSFGSMLRRMNPEVNVREIPIKDAPVAISGRPDLILDLTNSAKSKERALKYGSSQGIRVFSASTNGFGGEMYFVKPGEEVSGAIFERPGEQGGFASEILGGMLTEEVRKSLMPLKVGEGPVKSLAYNTSSLKRFSRIEDFEPQPYEDLSQKRILIVGSGALGNFAALGAALEGIEKIDLLDFDEVEAHNLNRQIMFYDSVGKAKSQALADKIRKISQKTNVRGLVEKLDENTKYFAESKPDLILDCVDSFATRALVNYFAVHNKIPLVSGGTNSSSGQVIVYEPGNSACLECKMSVERALGMALQGSKCTNAPDPSVIMTNEIVGGMMVGESLKVLDKGYGAPVTRILKYDSTIPVRGGLVGPDTPCDCEKGEISGWLKELKERYSIFGGKK